MGTDVLVLRTSVCLQQVRYSLIKTRNDNMQLLLELLSSL